MYRAGERQAGFFGRVFACGAYPSEVVLNRLDHAGVIGAGQVKNVVGRDLARRNQRQASIRAANVPD